MSTGTGAKVVAWVAQEIGEDAIPEPWFTPDADRAQRLECTGRFAVDPLILQADHLAELQAAREAGIREALEVLRDARGRARTHYSGNDPVPFWMKRAEERVAALLIAPPTPDNEQEG